jgi:L-threonine-O-3-phosphate decarboxylase
LEENLFKTRPIHGGDIAWAAQVAKCSPFVLRDFSASICPLGPPASAIAAIQDSLDHLTHYPPPDYGALCQALGHHHRVAPESVLPGNGAAELFTWAGRELAALEATYLLTPAFGDYRRALTAFDAHSVPCRIPLAAAATGQVDWLTFIAQGLHHDPKRCGLLLNTPHNPTGLVMPLAVLETLLDQFALVVVDEAFMDFLPPEQQSSLIPQIERWPNLVILRSLTKFYSLPGLRLGYAIAHPERLSRWQQWRDPWPVNSLAAAAAIAVLPDHDYPAQVWHWLATARPQLHEQLEAIPGLHPFPGQANYLLVRTEHPGSHLQRQLLTQHRILIRDCLSFPELGDQYFRVAVRSVADNERLVTGLQSVVDSSLPVD